MYMKTSLWAVSSAVVRTEADTRCGFDTRTHALSVQGQGEQKRPKWETWRRRTCVDCLGFARQAVALNMIRHAVKALHERTVRRLMSLLSANRRRIDWTSVPDLANRACERGETMSWAQSQDPSLTPET